MRGNWYLLTPGVALAWWAARELALGRASRRWPTADGRVLDADIEEAYAPRRGWTYTPTIRYEYRAAGEPYVATRRRYGFPLGGSHSVAEDALAPYPPGARVAVRYRPGHPHHAVLEPGTPWGMAGVLLLGLALAVAGALH